MIRKFGGPEVLELAEVPAPVPGDDQVLIQVQAASVNPVDWRIRDGAAKTYAKTTFPTILGCDLAGVVAEVGERVSNFAVGDRVFAMMPHDWGAQAELVALAEGLVVKLPSGLSMEEASALPVPGLTALLALRTRGKVHAGQRVLINGGSSSVGMAAVQIAAADGANVTAVCGQDSFGVLTELGATELIDYRTTDFAAGPTKYDLIFDCIGNKPHGACKGVINSHGAHVTTTPRVATFIRQFLNPLFSVKVYPLITTGDGSQLAAIKSLVEAGKLRPVIDRILPVDEVAAAHQYSKSGRAKGKIVLQFAR
ncbi:MAG: NAD(P)-dependent alcohol dehydrogenase [Candidatus Dormibacteraeota bacterium]|nr:NAD(P)-dependent alcohol dehydrogenase [Candidatus Dormibacteraeota bacterium]